MARYRLTTQARTGLRNILDYAESRFGVRVAEQILDKLLGAFELLARSPGIGHRREDITSNDAVLFWSVRPSLLAYRVVDGVVEALFVERGERDWERLLEDGF